VRELGCQHEASVPSKTRIGCTGTNAIQPANRSDQRFSERRGWDSPRQRVQGRFSTRSASAGTASLTLPPAAEAGQRRRGLLHFAENGLPHSSSGCNPSRNALSCNASQVAAPGQKGERVSLGKASATPGVGSVTRTKVQRSGRMTMTLRIWPCCPSVPAPARSTPTTPCRCPGAPPRQ
jgi:hypothetical protein